VVQEPSAGLSIYRCRVGEALVYFSDLKDLHALAGIGLHVSWDYMAANVIGPDLQTEMTAFKEVSELHGIVSRRVVYES
jgi:hypothetical protein